MRKNIERDLKRYKRKLRKRLRQRQPKRYKFKKTKTKVCHIISPIDQMKALARETFINMPEEVCQLWLDDRISNCGWPPEGLEWQGFLFRKSIEHWQQLAWEEKNVSLEVHQIAPISLELVSNLIEAHEHGKPNILTLYMPDSKSRYDSINDYLKTNKAVPGKIILMETELGYEIIDGVHRVTAALMFQLNNSLKLSGFNAWIGK